MEEQHRRFEQTYGIKLIQHYGMSEGGTVAGNHHLARRIGDQRESVALFADAGRHGGAHQRRVHLDAGVAQRVLDDVERDRVDRDLAERGGVGFDDGGGH